MGTVTRQDVQNIVDVSRSRILERTVTKQDIAPLAEHIRQLLALHQHSQQMLKQSEYQRLQLGRRTEMLEARINSLEVEIRALVAATNRAVEQKQQPVTVPAPMQGEHQTEPGIARQYGYQPG